MILFSAFFPLCVTWKKTKKRGSLLKVKKNKTKLFLKFVTKLLSKKERKQPPRGCF